MKYNLLTHTELKNKKVLSDISDNNGNNETNNNKLTLMDLSLKSDYTGNVVFELLQLTKIDSKNIRRVERNKENQINTVAIFNNIKQFTADTSYSRTKCLTFI